MITSAKFDWSREAALPVKTHLAATVYSNLKGEIIIRQQADLDEAGDTVITLVAGNAAAIAKALMAAERELARPIGGKRTPTRGKRIKPFTLLPAGDR